MDIVVYGMTAMNYWRRVSAIGGIGAVSGMVPLCPADTLAQALPRRRGTVPVGPPSSEMVGLLEHYGIVTPDHPAHVLVRTRTDRREIRGITCHVCEREIPARSLHPVDFGAGRARGIYVCSPELALLQMSAAGLSLVEFIELGMELCGTYRMLDGAAIYGCEPLMDSASLRAFLARARGLPGLDEARRAAPWVMDGSASPAETDLAISFALPWRYGGANLGVPLLNHEIRLNEEGRAILGCDTMRPDQLFVGPRVAGLGFPCEYDSVEYHSSRDQAARDERRRNALAAMGMGCAIIRPQHLRSVRAFDDIARLVRCNVGARVRDLPDDYDERHRRLLSHTLKQWARRDWSDVEEW